jgi:hypothetical protein
MIFKFISIPVFLVSLAAGLLFVYLSNPTPAIIYVYPTPDNKDKFQYVDKIENCFSFDETEVTCPKNASEIKHIPFQK